MFFHINLSLKYTFSTVKYVSGGASASIDLIDISLRHETNERHLNDRISECIFVKNDFILINISLKLQ